MNDKQRLDWLEAQEGCALVSDEAGSWAVAMFGMQNVPVDFPSDAGLAKLYSQGH